MFEQLFIKKEQISTIQHGDVCLISLPGVDLGSYHVIILFSIALKIREFVN